MLLSPAACSSDQQIPSETTHIGLGPITAHMGVRSAPRVWLVALTGGWRVMKAMWWPRRAGCVCGPLRRARGSRGLPRTRAFG